MTVLRECPEHGVALEIAGSQLQCPMMADAPWTDGIWERPKKYRCTYTEPLPPGVALRAAGAALQGLPGDAMNLFDYCICGHEEERHATDAPEGQWECLDEDCKCLNFEFGGGEGATGIDSAEVGDE